MIGQINIENIVALPYHKVNDLNKVIELSENYLVIGTK
jgi:hypothetical protein